MNKWIVIAAACWAAIGCGNDRAEPDAGPPLNDRERVCAKARSAEPIPQRLDAVAPIATMTFDELVAQVNSACADCHKKPTANGDFSYTSDLPGLSAAMAKMASAVVSRTMPPKERRDGDPAAYDRLGKRMQAWITAGKPASGPFELPDEVIQNGQQLPAAIAAAMTDIGDCIPVTDVVGVDAERDAMFAAATALPERLEQTDLISLDALVLAQRGTVAYDVEYPLWADNAHKGRWVHVPSSGGERKPITYDAAAGKFTIPDNTRFYKTFFKSVKETDGMVRYRKVETRLIVVRHAPAKPLFGTYVWDKAEQGATLHTLPYRDTTPFKDLVLELETDAVTHETRHYAVPGRNRCNECHQGSESDSFVLGFTPLQVNRRAVGEAGREAEVKEDELSQLDRLVQYGVVASMTKDTAPKLEGMGGAVQPRNIHELRFQAYATGNCGHCHNPKGYAATQSITMMLAPPAVFQFKRGLNAQIGSGSLMVPSKPATSVLFQHISQETHVQGSEAFLRMPLHTPGMDCNGVNLLGRWITSIPASLTPTQTEFDDAMRFAETYDSGCQPQKDISWLDEDFSDPPVYAPRRGDWNNTSTGMPAAIRALEMTPDLLAVADKPVPVGYWLSWKVNGVAQCRFPDAPAPEGGPSPWMVDANNQPRRPYGELYYKKPGAYFFDSVCYKCHGPHADADTSLAKSILALTGGETRVANLHDGLFGHAGANHALFDVTENGVIRNLAPNYLVWMASGGTQAKFPPVLGDLIGDHGGNMLFLVRSRFCALLLPGAPLGQYNPTYQNYDVVAKACAFDNPMDDPDLGFRADGQPINAALQNAWLDRAVRNVGFMIYRYLLVDGAVDNWPVNDCRVVYPAN